MRFGICGTKRTVQKMRGVFIYCKVRMFEVCYLWVKDNCPQDRGVCILELGIVI